MKIFIGSTVHRWDDTRIFYRQASSLAKKYEVELHAPADFGQKIEHGVKIIGMPKWTKESDRIKSWWIMLRRVLKSNAAVFHFHDPELVPMGLIIKIFTGKKVVYDVHEHYLNDIKDKAWIPKSLRGVVCWLFSMAEYMSVPWFDAVIYTTPIVGERYLSLSKNAVSIENYPMKSFFSGSATPQKGNNTNDFIYLGRVFHVRGVEEIIRSWPKVLEKYPDVRFLIVGDVVPDSYDQQLQKLARDLHLEHHVVFHGFFKYDQAEKYLDSALAGFVTFLPFKNNMSCLPNKLFEYMASSVPVIASDFLLYRQIVEPAACGLLVDPTDVNQLAQAVISLLGDKSKAAEMGRQGRKAFLERYNWEKEEHKLFEVYSTLFESILS